MKNIPTEKELIKRISRYNLILQKREFKTKIREYKRPKSTKKLFDYSMVKLDNMPKYLELVHNLVLKGYYESEIINIFGFRKGTIQGLKTMLRKKRWEECHDVYNSFEHLPYQISNDENKRHTDKEFRNFIFVYILNELLEKKYFIRTIPGEIHIINEMIEIQNSVLKYDDKIGEIAMLQRFKHKEIPDQFKYAKIPQRFKNKKLNALYDMSESEFAQIIRKSIDDKQSSLKQFY